MCHELNIVAKRAIDPYKDEQRLVLDNDLTEAEKNQLLQAEKLLGKIKTFVNWARLLAHF